MKSRQIFSIMKSRTNNEKQTVVRGPTGGGRPQVTGFYLNPCISDHDLETFKEVTPWIKHLPQINALHLLLHLE